MDKYFKTKKTRNEPEFDLDFQRQIEEDLKNFKYEPVDHSFRDDLSDYNLASARKSFARDPLNESVASSKDIERAFRDLRAANFERDQGLMEYEKDFNMAKMANKGEIMEYDYENLEYKPIIVKNELIAQEKLEEIKRVIQQKPVELPESPETRKTNGLMRNNPTNFDDGAQLKTEESPRNIQEQEKDAAQAFLEQENFELARRLERAAMSREILQMEKEDARSLNYERFMHQEKFKDRLFCLPESFPVKKEAATRVANMECTLPRLKFVMPTIPKPIINPKEHLLETSKTEIDKILLNKITNKKKPKMAYHKISEKDKTLLSKSKFDASIANSKTSLLNKEKEEKSLINIRRLPSKESQTLVPSRVLSDKTNRLGDSFEKGSSKIPNLAKWILNKSLALYPKLAKIDQSAVKAAMKEVENFPTYKVFYDQIISAAIDLAPFNELEPNLDNEGMPKSLDSFISRVQQKNLRKLEIKMEELIDIKSVGQLKSLQLLTLPMNKIQDIREISSLKSLIEIDLSQNSIKSMKGLSNLKYLRHLNLEVNQITKIEDLEGCDLLEVLNLNNNQISRIEGLKTLKRLKKLYLFRNKITKMDGIEDAVWLEELDLGRNQIKEISNINKLPVLRKLVLYFNQIEKLPQNFSHISLSEIWLNGNKLTEISDLAYFPSLKYLNFQENEIATLTNHSLMFIPNLRGLNLSFNKIGSFGEVYRLIVHFGSLQQIDLGENLFLRGTTETLRAFYESILVTLLPNLMELNGKQITERITLKISSEKPSNDTLYLHPGRLENDAYHIDKLTSSKLNRHQGIFYIQSRQITANVNNGLFYLSKINETSSLQQGEMYILDHKYSYDIHRSAFKYKESLHKVKSFLLDLVHKRRLRKKHFVKNLDKIIKIQANCRGYCVRQVHNVSRKFKLDKYATKIQRRYRLYRETMRRRRILGGIRYEDDLDEFVEVDVDFKEPDYDALKLKIPENFSMRQFVPAMLSQPPQTYNANTGNNHSQNASAPKAPDSSIKKQQNVKYKGEEENKEDDDLSVVSASSSQNHRRIKLKATQPNADKQKFIEERDKAMGDWGFKDENSKMAFGLFLKKQQNRKEKKKELTAMERYEKMYGKK